MASPQFNNLTELNNYLNGLDKRIAALESEEKVIKGAINDLGNENYFRLPRTGLLSHNFLWRAFTIWGHYFVAQLILGLFFGLIYLFIFLLIISRFPVR